MAEWPPVWEVGLFVRFAQYTCLSWTAVNSNVFSYFPFGFEGRIWDLIVSVPDHCISFYFSKVFIFRKKVLKEKMFFQPTNPFFFSRVT